MTCHYRCSKGIELQAAESEIVLGGMQCEIVMDFDCEGCEGAALGRVGASVLGVVLELLGSGCDGDLGHSLLSPLVGTSMLEQGWQTGGPMMQHLHCGLEELVVEVQQVVAVEGGSSEDVLTM